MFQLVAERALLGTFMQLSGLDFHTAFYLTHFTGVRDFVSLLRGQLVALSALHPQKV